MFSMMLLLLSLLPPLLFLLYILGADSKEPEPYEMILFALGLGIVSTVPASLLEGLLDFIPIFGHEGFFGAMITSFIQVAPVEEACKLAVILLFVWRNRNFNEENDGIVYVTMSAIGFAMFENIMYVFQGDSLQAVVTSIGRGVTSIPLHTFCGIIMGYYVGRARFSATRKDAGRLILKGFGYAWLIHGLYDTFAMAGFAYGIFLIMLVFVLFMVGRKLVKDGKALSESRWGDPDYVEPMKIDTPEQNAARAIARYGKDKVLVDEEGRYYLKPERQLWKAIVGGLLLAGSVFVWRLFALYVGENESGNAVGSVVYLSVMTTCVPIVLAIMLLFSYHRRREANYYF